MMSLVCKNREANMYELSLALLMWEAILEFCLLDGKIFSVSQAMLELLFWLVFELESFWTWNIEYRLPRDTGPYTLWLSR